MAGSNFDDKIREKLEGLNPEFHPDSWLQLEQRMQVEADEALDQKVKEELEAVSESYDDTTWGILLGRLRQWESLRREFYILRAGEVIILALLFLAFHQYGSILSTSPKIEVKPTAHYESTDGHPDDVVSQAVLTDESVEVAEDSGIESTPRNIETQSDQNRFDNDPMDAALTNVDGNFDQGEILTFQKFQEEEITISDLSPLSKLIEGSKAVLPDDKISELSSIEAGDHYGEIMMSGSDQRNGFVISEIGMIGASYLESPEIMIPVSSSMVDPGKTFRQSKTWLTILSHSSLNQVFTPADGEFAENNAYTSGYGFGLLFGFENGRFTWETGAEYEFGIFRPKRTKLTGNIRVGYGSTTLSEINVDYINIPLQSRMKIWEHHGHSFYLLGGLKLHVSSKVDFDFVEESGSSNFPGDFQLGIEPEEIHGVERGRFTYLTLNGGFGYEKQLNRSARLFIQPSYEYYAEKHGILNLNGEKVNTIRLDFGVRVGL